jgi:tetratricopeptide (TPR) repeat protein
VAKDELQAILELNPSDFEAANNFAVCLLYLGELDESIAAMEDLVSKANGEPDFLMEQAIFNLCTLYELRSDGAMEKKVQKLQQLHPILGDVFHVESFKM